MGIRAPQNPGISGLDELTVDEELFIQNLVALSYVEGDVLYYDGTKLNRLAVGTNGEVLTLAAGVPSWASVSGTGDVVGPAAAVDSNFAAFDLTTGKLIKDSGSSASTFATAAQGALAASASQPGHTHTASEVTDFDTEVANNSAVALNTTKITYPSADSTKVGFISVTQTVDLDQMESDIAALDAAVVLQGTWDASVGTFPGGGTAQAGASYIVSAGGTVDGEVFVANDRIVAILDNASTTVYASNWHKLDYTDQVLSVAGKTGAVTLVKADITDFDAYVPGGTDVPVLDGGTGASTAAGARTNLGLVIGTDVQAFDATNATASSTTTFTNKTFDANAAGNSLSNIDVADLANGTDGELITWSATGVPTTVAVGTADQVLTSNGPGAAPTFQAAGGGGADIQTFTVNGTWTKPASGTTVRVQIWAGGGSGGLGDEGSVAGGGGGGGGYKEFEFAIGDTGATETITIGDGGAAVSVIETAGNVGGNTTFGSLLTAYGGGGGASNTTNDGYGGGGGGGMTAVGETPTTNTGGDGGAPAGYPLPETSTTDNFAGEGGVLNSSGANGSVAGGGGGGGGGGSTAGNTHAGGDSSHGGAGGGGGINGSATTEKHRGGSSYYGGAGGGGAATGTSGGTAGTSVHGGDGGVGGWFLTGPTDGSVPGGGGGGQNRPSVANSGAGGKGKCVVTTI